MGRRRQVSDQIELDDEQTTPPSRPQKSTYKVQERDKENLAKANKTIEALKKQMKRLRRTQKDNDDNDSCEDNDGPEPESQDDEDCGFSSSIKHLPATDQEPNHTPLRRINLAQINDTVTTSKRRRVDSSATSSPQPPVETQSDNSTRRRSASALFDNDDALQGSYTSNPSPQSDRSLDRDPSATPTSTETHRTRFVIELVPSLKESAPPTLADFADPIVRALLLTAMHEYEALVLSKSAFPSLATQALMATQCWNNSQTNRNSKVGDENATSFELTDRMLCLIKHRGTRIRSELLDDVRAEVQTIFGFRKDRPSYARKNATIVTKLTHDKSFPYKVDPETRSGYCQNEIILSVLTATIFKDTKAVGAKYHELFNPMPVNTLALIFTMEWKTGKIQQGVFSEKDFGSLFTAFHEDLVNWCSLNPEVTKNRRKKLFARAIKSSGVVMKDVVPTLVGDMVERARQELEGHTGETDSEVDDGEIDGSESEAE
ncbi:hypothetical protein H0H92_006578 [Tricholoma furcatifolium]|nr:hypothetical protein H0H92_006578 [Tricholoma furcatifolium]